jgi:hypothetical protein
MARSNVSFVLGTGSLGQAAAGNDFISGQVLYGTAPGSFATSPYQAVYDVADAVTKGIALDYGDETVAKSIYTVSGTVTVGDTFAMTVTEQNPVTPTNPTGTTVVSLGTATVATAATATGAGVDIIATINAGTYSHGYSATAVAGVITISARPGTGIMLNTGTPLAVTVVGTSVGTITQQFGTGTGGATAGVYSKKAVWHYIVSEFFRANPTGVLWVGFFAAVSATYADVVTLANAAGGTCKQIGVFDPTVTSAATFNTKGTTLQARAVDLFNAYNPAEIHYTANLKAVADLSTLVNQQNNNNYRVHHVILQDGGAAGAQLYINCGISIGNIGCSLGTTSAAKVNQDIGEIGAFNITDAVEMVIPAFINGQLVSALSSNLLDQLDAYRYIFATGQPNITGTFFVNDWSSTVQTSPYNRQSRNRTMNKAVRLVYTNLVPLLKSQIGLNTDGTISDVSLAKFNGAVIPVGTQMKDAGEISNLRVTINTSQNIISAGKVVVGIAIQPTITADFIEAQMSFVAKI